MSRAMIQIGPADHGRRMSLADFEHAEGIEGHLYELSKGVVTVMDVPDWPHLAQLEAARMQFYAYSLANEGAVRAIAGGMECEILLPGEESERHPDLAVYLSDPPTDDAELWTDWVPDIAIEVVSRTFRQRDYLEKREEYLKFGVREYWIIDFEKQRLLALRRSGGRWIEKVVDEQDLYEPRLLPGFQFHVKRCFDAVRKRRPQP